MECRNRALCRVCALCLSVLLISAMVAGSAFAAVLRYGSRGDSVKKVQQILKEKSLYTGEIDGIYGPKTTEAVKKFQKGAGLVVDGITGPKTLAALGMGGTSSGGGGSSGTASHNNDLALVARMIAAEARGESYLGQVAIGAVIMNRVKHPSFPNTISGVLYQKGAFSAVGDGQFASTPVPDSCVRAAAEAFNGSDPTGGCVFYYNPSKTTNAFMTSKPIIIRIGKHVFCK